MLSGFIARISREEDRQRQLHRLGGLQVDYPKVIERVDPQADLPTNWTTTSRATQPR